MYDPGSPYQRHHGAQDPRLCSPIDGHRYGPSVCLGDHLVHPRLWSQFAVPQRTLSRLVRLATRWTWRPWKNWLIRRIVRTYDIRLDEAAIADADAYLHFDAFFTRALKPHTRAATPAPETILCPADGRISQAGRIVDGLLFQAKGQFFSVGDLLADSQAAETYQDGCFVTVYLSPRDYHRVHMPWSGRLVHTTHIPGHLFSVAPHVVTAIPGLFARNERLVCHFESTQGPFVVIMVGAMLVSGISTTWSGDVVPPYARSTSHTNWRPLGIQLSRFAEMGRFHMGSTVIILFPTAAKLHSSLHGEQAVQVGQGLGTWDLGSPESAPR